MENLPGKRKPTISLSLFTNLSDSFSFDKHSNSAKTPRNFEGGVVGLGIVAAMTDSGDSHEVFSPAKFGGAPAANLAVSPRSTPIPIVSSAKPAANFRGGLNSERKEEVDELSESYTCVISHFGNNVIRKRVYFDDELNAVEDCDVCMVTTPGVFSASPVNVGELGREFWTADFLNSCFLCNKQLHGLDIFMYRGEKAFCSAECRDRHIRSEDCKDKCRSEALKPLDFSSSPCSAPMVFLAAGVAAA
ncbi:hypothetical protein FNV43_RR20030 [Rhamnella rubrinervis]|uniref:FLZ-type domain-containing protein n=1 Tax=Rhamnella rubrinervis TaxID=2594499 RepID=A0A8K0GQ27_9ROSA|nr:hypothetical protein FNV43_RR20030 [Rhamnella rubrinervis]